MADDRSAEAALDAEATRDVDVEWVRHEVPPKNPSAVYSVRIPTDRIEQLRRVAAERGAATAGAAVGRAAGGHGVTGAKGA